MLFPEPKFSLGRSWFLIPHDVLYPWVEKRHSHAGAWKQMWSYPIPRPVDAGTRLKLHAAKVSLRIANDQIFALHIGLRSIDAKA
jgi:hypothetical protein